MARENYLYCCYFDDSNLYFIWFSNEKDGVCCEPDGEIAAFNDLESLRKYAEVQNILIRDEEAFCLNLDKIEESLKQPLFEVDCVDFLNAWNLFTDVSVSLKGNFDSERKATEKIYDKLFWGNNLPAVTPEGEFYTPIWSRKELEIIREVLQKGFILFRSSLKIID
jgi:hypothetical protein